MVSATVDPALPVREHDGRTLDWRPRFDPRSLEHRVAAVAGVELPTAGRLWPHGTVLDQGREGACVGMGCAGEAAAQPVPVPGVTSAYARGWYHNAQRLDAWPGEAYEGTSVLAGLLEGRKRGLYAGFRWAKSAEELAAGIVLPASRGGGPAVIGVEWRGGSYDTDPLGVLRPSGDVVGGHCLCVVGFVPTGARRDSAVGRQLVARDLWDGYLSVGGPVFVVLNSWGPEYGRGGLALVPLQTMRAWVAAGGEFAIPQGRKLPATAAAPVEAAPRDRTLHLAARELQDGDRVLECTPALFGQESVTLTERPRLVSAAAGELARLRSTAGVFTLRASQPVTVRRPIA